MINQPLRFHLAALSLTCGLLWGQSAKCADQPQWGQRHTRNMVSDERGLPDTFDPATGQNVKWTVELGSQAYASPVIAQGRVFIGANNDVPQDPRQKDSGVLLCLNEATGQKEWQLVVPRLLGEGPYLDQPRISFCSPPTIEGDRVYVVTNRSEVVCLDLDGMADGNDGPYLDEGQHMVQPGEQPIEVLPNDADIVWLYDLIAGSGIHPHDSAHSSLLLDGRYLYLNTGNGVDHRDDTRTFIPKPDAPSLIVMDKQTGKVVAQDAERIGPNIYHCTWSSPALGEVNGQRLIFFCGGDGVVYAFEALPQDLTDEGIRPLKRVWRYDCDPKAPKENVHSYFKNSQVSPSNIMGAPVFSNNRIYVTGGGDFWWGKTEAWAQCIDATLSGDITETGKVWEFPLRRHACTTPAVFNGMAFVGDLGRKVYCLDADTGKELWSHGMKGEVWSSILVADGKVYVGSGGSDFCILEAKPVKNVLATIRLDSEMLTSPMAANGVLYINTLSRLYAIEQAK